MSSLAFTLTSFDYGSGPAVGVDPVLGDTTLRDLVARFERRHGFDPAGGYGPLLLDAGRAADRYLARSDPAPVALLGCVCGDEGCWPLTASVVVTPDRVTWSDFAQPHRPAWSYEGFGPFGFPRAGYDAAVRDLAGRLDGMQ